MVAKPVQLEEALALALRLSPLDKVRLLERVALTLENDLTVPPTQAFETFEGVLSYLGPGPTDDDIVEIRQAMMQNFPREDIDL